MTTASTEKVLIVEDEDLLSSAFSMILQKGGYEVKVARDGMEALETIPEFNPGLILLDLLMPRMGGIEFLQKFTSSVSTLPPIVVLSNLHDAEIISQVKRLGVVDYIVKSEITPDKMSALVNKIFKNI